MNKKELKKEMEKLKRLPVTCNEGYERGFSHAVFILDDLINKLDEPELPVIPRFVADWIELCKERAYLSDCLQGMFLYGNNESEAIKVDEDWLFEYDNADLVARAWLDGYTIEKEPRWVVFYVNDKNKCFKDFNGINGFVYSSIEEAIKFDDEEKAKAVALLTDGQVEEVTECIK